MTRPSTHTLIQVYRDAWYPGGWNISPACEEGLVYPQKIEQILGKNRTNLKNIVRIFFKFNFLIIYLRFI